MAPRHIPERDADRVELIRSFRPSGSSTVVSVWDAGAGVRLPMLRWGDSIYSPVYDGMRFGIEVHNGRDDMIAVPTFVEGANLWVGGPLDPEACTPSHMWELEPRQTMLVDAMMNPSAQRGRPIVITRTGLGATVGEATFGTDAFRGQLRVYERHPTVPRPRPAGPPAMAAAPMVHAAPGHVDRSSEPRAYAAPAAPAPMPAKAAAPPPPAMAAAREMAGPPPPPAMAMAMARPAPAAPPAPAERSRAPAARGAAQGPAGFGAGEEEERQHRFTGVEYHRAAILLVSLRIEMRADLEEIVRAQLGSSWSWQWPAAWGDDSIADPWMWPAPPTAPHIPVTRPGPR